jgi:hypothetical protein
VLRGEEREMLRREGREALRWEGRDTLWRKGNIVMKEEGRIDGKGEEHCVIAGGKCRGEGNIKVGEGRIDMVEGKSCGRRERDVSRWRGGVTVKEESRSRRGMERGKREGNTKAVTVEGECRGERELLR